jgi:hypothetical protein
MAENRTFKFYGLGYGAAPVSITASINGQQVFSGEIPTVNEPLDPFPYPTPPEIASTAMFTLDNFADLSTDFAGSVPMSVTVNSGRGAIFSIIQCNWTIHGDPSEDNELNGSADQFKACYSGDLGNAENNVDVRYNVAIDGVQQQSNTMGGIWDWRVFNGSTITYDLNVDIGCVGNVYGHTGNYVGTFTPVPNWPPAV